MEVFGEIGAIYVVFVGVLLVGTLSLAISAAWLTFLIAQALRRWPWFLKLLGIILLGTLVVGLSGLFFAGLLYLALRGVPPYLLHDLPAVIFIGSVIATFYLLATAIRVVRQSWDTTTQQT